MAESALKIAPLEAPFTRLEYIPFTAPNLCKEHGILYDNLEFEGFASRQGWLLKPFYPCDPACMEFPGTYCPTHGCFRTQTFSRDDGRHVSNTEMAAFLQAWLFFGTLSDVSAACDFHLDIEKDILVEGGNTVSTRALNGLASRWFDALRTKEPEELERRLERILAALRQLTLLRSGFLQDPEISLRNRNFAAPRDYRVLLSINVLGKVVGLLLSYYPPLLTDRLSAPSPIGIPEDKRFLHDTNFKSEVPVAELETATLEKKGWCRSQCRRLGELDTSYLVFANHIERPQIGQVQHTLCSDLACRADHISDEENYRTAHYAGCSGTCDNISVDGNELADVLERGSIPRIQISSDLQLTVVDKGPYICISHVWAHGLGNPHGNSLPRCQIHRLRAQITEQSQQQPISLWMDTLCIPVHRELKEYRKKAIYLLGRTFIEATSILVLDRELETIESSSAPILELAIRINCSGWMQRLWTFQEAACAIEDPSDLNLRRLYFQMADGALSYQTFTSFTSHRGFGNNRFQLSEDDLADAHFYGEAVLELHRRICSLKALRASSSPFTVICGAVASRTTSKMEDEPLILATIMELDIPNIMRQTSTTLKWQQLYTMMGKIAPEVIFDRYIQRLPDVPFRWAPSSILVNSIGLSTDPSQWGICTPNGLNIIYPGLLFREDSLVTNSGVLRDEKTGRCFKLFDVLDTVSGKKACQLTSGTTAVIYGNWVGAVIVSIEGEAMVKAWDTPKLMVKSFQSHWETEIDSVDGPWCVFYATVVGFAHVSPLVIKREHQQSDIMVSELSQWQRWVIT